MLQTRKTLCDENAVYIAQRETFFQPRKSNPPHLRKYCLNIQYHSNIEGKTRQISIASLPEPSVIKKLNDADLSAANLSRTDIRYARLIRAQLSDADLKGASLTGAFLDFVNLRGAIYAHEQLIAVASMQSVLL